MPLQRYRSANRPVARGGSASGRASRRGNEVLNDISALCRLRSHGERVVLAQALIRS